MQNKAFSWAMCMAIATMMTCAGCGEVQANDTAGTSAKQAETICETTQDKDVQTPEQTTDMVQKEQKADVTGTGAVHVSVDTKGKGKYVPMVQTKKLPFAAPLASGLMRKVMADSEETNRTLVQWLRVTAHSNTCYLTENTAEEIPPDWI